MTKRLIIGAGQCGMKLAHKFYTQYTEKSKADLVAFSTSSEDSIGIPNQHLVQVSKEGSGKKYTRGSDIWRDHADSIERALRSYKETEVVYFMSAGGGSGSSSVPYILDELIQRRNKIILVMILPFGYETLPFKPNALQALNTLQSQNYLDKVSVLLFDNDKLSKLYTDVEDMGDEKVRNYANIDKINCHITRTTSLMLDMIRKYHDPTKASPFTIDELEHESVIFSHGYIGVDICKDNPALVKFDYGKISDAKNIIVAKAMSTRITDYLVDQNVGNFLDVVKRISRKAKNARIMYGIIRTDKIENGTYIVIGNNLDISKYTTKIKAKVGENIEKFRQRDIRNSVLDDDETRMFDV